jgi:hypothetical protein
MSTWPILGVLLVIGICIVRPELSDGWPDEGGQGRWWPGEWKDEFRDGPCQVKREAKRGAFKRQIKCKDGVGARWHDEWKDEFRDGPCQVKVEAKPDEYKEEVKCDRDY